MTDARGDIVPNRLPLLASRYRPVTIVLSRLRPEIQPIRQQRPKVAGHDSLPIFRERSFERLPYILPEWVGKVESGDGRLGLSVRIARSQTAALAKNAARYSSVANIGRYQLGPKRAECVNSTRVVPGTHRLRGPSDCQSAVTAAAYVLVRDRLEPSTGGFMSSRGRSSSANAI